MRKARRRAAWLTPSKLGNAVLHKSDRKDCEVLMKGFSWCGNLTRVTIPDSVTFIGGKVFYHCDNLLQVIFADGEISVGKNPFCETSTEIVVSSDHPTLAVIDGILFDKQEMRLIFYPCADKSETYSIPQGTKVIGDNSFSNCSSLTQIIIPNSVTSIGVGAFYDCENLTQVTIPNSVSSIGDEAFCACDSLSRVIIPDSVTHIGYGAFSFCDSLTEVIIPESVTHIGYGAFSFCDSLTQITIPDSVTSIGGDSFRN